MPKYLDKTFWEYIKTGLWLALGNIIAGIIGTIIWWIVFAILAGIIGLSASTGKVEVFLAAGIIGIFIGICILILNFAIVGIIFDKYIKKKVQ